MHAIERFFSTYVHTDMAAFVVHTLVRLFLASMLGGLIGLERELKGKPAGLRTNIFICFGSAMFTILSDRLAGSFGGDHTRIAAQIIPGIGFIGAGSILHSKGSVTGLTSAATMFVVASIGMAAGGGLYLAATVATLLLFGALHFLGLMEKRFHWKPQLVTYEVIGDTAEGTIGTINNIVGDMNKGMQRVQISQFNHKYRVQFAVEGVPSEQQSLMKRLRQAMFHNVERVGGPEEE